MQIKVAGQPEPQDKALADSETGQHVVEVDPLDTLQRFVKLHHMMLSAYSEYTETQYAINMNEYRVLMVVGRLGVTASHELAEKTGINIMSISRTVSALEERCILNVEIDPENRRRKLLRLTQQGDDLYNTVRPMADRVADYIFGSLKLDEFLAFDRHLRTLIRRVGEVDENNRSVFLAKTKF